MGSKRPFLSRHRRWRFRVCGWNPLRLHGGGRVCQLSTDWDLMRFLNIHFGDIIYFCFCQFWERFFFWINQINISWVFLNTSLFIETRVWVSLLLRAFPCACFWDAFSWTIPRPHASTRVVPVPTALNHQAPLSRPSKSGINGTLPETNRSKNHWK